MSSATEVFEPLRGDDPPVVAGYRLAARLGAGGMGRVYLSHTQGGRPVAIKVVRPELADDQDFRRRFRREVEAARRVRGAYTAELIDADAEGTPPWLATLYVPGPSLAQAVSRRGPLPVPAVLWLMAGVAEALQAIHGAGIVHRDLKPSNVLLAADGPRVIDFGISLAADATFRTATGSAVGTPQFMAPEQAVAGDVTEATDVFALGQTAAFAALGRALYGEGPAATVLYRIVHERPDLSALPEQLRPLIARCLAAEAAERATLAEVVEWCRGRLGSDADAGAGPAVWREVTGPEVSVPSPVPDLAQVGPSPVPDPTRVLHQAPLVVTRPQPQPAGPEERRARRRRTALITASAVTAVALLTGLVWTLPDARDRFRDWASGGSVTPGPNGSTRSSESSEASARASDKDTDAGTPKDAKPSPSPTAPASPGPIANSPLWLDAKTSLSFTKPFQRRDRKGDIRFDCKDAGCSLDSDTSVFVQIFDDTGAKVSLDECRLLLASADRHRWPLAAAANGSQICVRHSSGDIALLVLQTKSTALPDLAFLQLDMTIWRKAA